MEGIVSCYFCLCTGQTIDFLDLQYSCVALFVVILFQGRFFTSHGAYLRIKLMAGQIWVINAIIYKAVSLNG